MINEKVAYVGIKKGKKYNFKKICNNIHLWLGIASAIVLFVVCLTGTIFVFHTEIEKLLYPKWFTAKSDAAHMKTPDVLIENVEKVTNGKVVSFVIPASRDEVWLFSIKGKSKTTKSSDKLPTTSTDEEVAAEKNKVFYVNPYTGAITGIGKSPAGKFFVTIENIHRWFFIGKPVGKAVGGSAALIFILLIISGIAIWFPKKLKHWREGFKIKFSAKWKRVNFDLHRALGAYVFPVILLCAITGPSWSFNWYRLVTSKVLHKEVLKKEKALSLDDTVNVKAQKVTYTQIMDTAEFYIPENGITLINIPSNKTSAVSIIKTHTGFCSLAAIDNIQINPYSGKALKLSLFSDLSLGKKIATVFRAIHVGEIFGTLSKIIYFLACLLATSLPITGILIWLNKLKKPKRKNKTHSV